MLCVCGRALSLRPALRNRDESEVSNRPSLIPISSPSPLSPRPDRRSAVAADGLQHAIGLRGLRHRVSAARAAALQFQQSAGGVSRVRGFWERHRHRHGSGRSRSGQVAPRRGDRTVEHAGLRPRAEGAAGAGARLRLPVGRAVPRAFRTAAGVDSARRARAEVRRAGGFFRLAGAAEVQDAHPRVLEPVAEFSALSGLRRHAAAAGGAGGADRRQEPRRNLRHEGPRRRRVLPRPATARLGAADRPHDARTGAGAVVVSGSGGAGLPDARPHAAHASAAARPAAWRSPRRWDRAW